jgi:phosphatidylethanolamine-binding protein (PEBP) family uncharacterized protein
MKFRIKKTFRRKHINTRKYTCRAKKRRGGTDNNNFKVQYGDITVNGQLLTKEQTNLKPSISFQPTTQKLYTVVMWDPDAPNPSFVHWILINLKSPNNASQNDKELLEYMGPSPPSGIHTYYFGLFEQTRHIKPEKLERRQFSIDNFIKNNNLTEVSRVYMKVSN